MLLVVLFHAGLPLSGGFTGVDVFFVISGFVIGGVLLAELEERDRVDLAGFYRRRVRRLLPALALMVTVVALAGVLLSPVAGDHEGGITGILASAFSANVYLLREGTGYFASDQALNPFLHTWTLAVEEQFYVFFPAVLILSWALARRGRRKSHRLSAGLVIALVSLLSFVFSLRLSSGPPAGLTAQERFAFYGSPTRAWEFGLGALLVLATPFLVRLPSVVGLAAGVIGLSAILLGAIAIHGTSGYPGVAALVPAGGACAVLAAGTIGTWGVPRVMATRPLVWLGDLSYGLVPLALAVHRFRDGPLAYGRCAGRRGRGCSFVAACLGFASIRGEPNPDEPAARAPLHPWPGRGLCRTGRSLLPGVSRCHGWDGVSTASRCLACESGDASRSPPGLRYRAALWLAAPTVHLEGPGCPGDDCASRRLLTRGKYQKPWLRREKPRDLTSPSRRSRPARFSTFGSTARFPVRRRAEATTPAAFRNC